MTLSDQYDGSGDPLEGDRTIQWRSLPVGAQVSQATVTITPVPAPGGTLFEEIISFAENPGSLGATKNGGSTFVEVDFHKRRTLAAVTGTSPGLLVNATLQVDVGGLYVEINDKGAIVSPSDAAPYPVDASGLLPGLTVSKFRLTAPPATNPDVSSVTIRSVTTNFSVRLADLRPFWTVMGELTTSATSPDFSSALQKILATANVENGYYVVPLTIHSDNATRLQVEIDCDFVSQASLLPAGVSLAVLPFDFGTLPKSGTSVLSANLPAGAQILPGQTTAQLLGSFNATRIVPGVGFPAGMAASGTTVDVSPEETQAQAILNNVACSAASVDLLLAATSPSTQLSLDLRPDFNGKPDQESLLSEPVQFTVKSNPTRQLDWVNVPLSPEFNFESGMTYWLVLASLEGNCNWGAEPTSQDLLPGVQHTLDGGLSWRQAGAVGIAGKLAGSFRLRTTPQSFQMPIQLQVGDANAVRVPLDRYQPLAQVNFELNAPELADAFNTYLVTGVTPPLPEGEHLANGTFQNWMVVPNTINAPFRLLSGESPARAVALSPDGRWIYVFVKHEHYSAIRTIDAVCESARRDEIILRVDSEPLAIAVHPSGTRAYAITTTTLHLVDLPGCAEKGLALTAHQFAEVIGLTAGSQFGSHFTLSPDGGQLYLTLGDVVASIGTAAVEAVAGGLRPLVKQDVRALLLPLQPAIMALNPDGTRLFLVAPGASIIQIVDTESLVLEANSIDVGNYPVAIDFTPDGSLAIVATIDSHTVTFVDTSSGSVVETGTLPSRPLAVAASPDGTRAYVLLLEQRAEPASQGALPELIPLREMPVLTLALRAERAVMAVNPQGDRVYIAAEDEVISVPTGTRIPGEWSIVSDDPAVPGEVVPICFPPQLPFVLGLEFGHRVGRGVQPNLATTGLSQVVPAAALCTFDFSFWALSDDSRAMAELFWLDQQSSLLRKDTVPIQNQTNQTPESLWEHGPRAVLGGKLRPILHRVRLTSPVETAQVEVRFTIPCGAAALLAQASMNATSEAVINGDFQMFQGGLPAGWTLGTPAVRGVSFSSGVSSVQFVNSSLADAELVQSASVQAAAQFTFEFLGRVVESATPAQNAQVTLMLLKADGSPAVSPTPLSVPAVGFGRYLAAGAFDPQAAQAAINLKVPSGMVLEIDQVSLKALQSFPVPVTFVAEAPGELRISTPVVTYNRIPVPPPPVPAQGLAAPTPPGQKPGSQPIERTYCPCCRTQQTMLTPRTKVTPAGRPVLVGRCATCGSELLYAGGKLPTGAPPLQFPILRIPEKAAGGLLHAPVEQRRRVLIRRETLRPPALAAGAKRANESAPRMRKKTRVRAAKGE